MECISELLNQTPCKLLIKKPQTSLWSAKGALIECAWFELEKSISAEVRLMLGNNGAWAAVPLVTFPTERWPLFSAQVFWSSAASRHFCFLKTLKTSHKATQCRGLSGEVDGFKPFKVLNVSLRGVLRFPQNTCETKHTVRPAMEPAIDSSLLKQYIFSQLGCFALRHSQNRPRSTQTELAYYYCTPNSVIMTLPAWSLISV